MYRLSRLLIMFVLTYPCVQVWGEGVSDLRGALAKQGKYHISIAVKAVEQQTNVPITVVTGSEPGPTLLILAGIHGSEYAPILASQKFGRALSPSALTGSVIIVHVANLPAYFGRTVYTSPADGLNLNRLFPGDGQGSLSQRVAHLITSQLYPLADAVLDVHSGDGNEDLRPYWTGYYAQVGDADLVRRSEALAFAFGFQHVVPFQWELTNVADAIWAGSAAVALGIPAIDVEAGGMGVIEDEAVAMLVEGFHRSLSNLGMISNQFDPPTNQRIIYARQSVKSPQDGSWVSLKAAGELVVAGELLGYVTDWHGKTVFEARAPSDGLLMLRLSAPPVLKGETLVVVAKTRSKR